MRFISHSSPLQIKRKFCWIKTISRVNRSKYHEKIENCSFTCKNLDRFYKSLPKNLTIARIEVQLATKITLFQLLCRKRHLARIKEFQKRKIREKIETSEKRLELIKKLRHRLRSLFCNTKWTALNLKELFFSARTEMSAKHHDFKRSDYKYRIHVSPYS